MGIWDVDGLLESIPARLMTEWMVYFKLEPFGDELLDTHLATMTSILANANRGKGEKARKPTEFQLWKAPEKPFDAEGFYENLRSWAILSGAKSE